MLTGCLIAGQEVNKKIIHTIDFAWLEACETGKGNCNPILITRQGITDSIQLIFPGGGTVSDVYLYTADPARRPLRHDQKRAGQGPPKLDLTGLCDGTYATAMMSCAVGAGFSIIIKTN